MLGEKIRKLREMKSFSQEYMANSLGISLGAYGKMERNQTDLNISRLEKIAEIFGMSMIDFLNFNEGSVFSQNNINESQTIHQQCLFQSEQNQKEVIDLYERMMKEKEELYQKMLNEKDEIIALLKNLLK